MELDPKSTTEAAMEMIAMILLTFMAISLGLTLGLAISWVIWNSTYLRNLLRDLFTLQQGDHHPMAQVIHEDSSDPDSSDDDDTADVDSGHVSDHRETGSQAQQ